MNQNIRIPRSLSPARSYEGRAAPDFATTVRHHVLLVDLNNFSTFPTLAIGLLIAALRNTGQTVELLSPLAHDVPAAARERQENVFDHLRRRISLTDMPQAYALRDLLRKAYRARHERPHPTVLKQAARAIARRPDVILISAYLQHMTTIRALAALAREAGIPVIVGGPMFNLTHVAQEWRQVPGISMLFGGEADLVLPDLLRTFLTKGDVLQYPGVTLADGRSSSVAPPLRPLDATPIPDFTDFPWDRYPVRIVPLMTGRGCQWDRCLFCSDVISASGRKFRTRSIDSVLLEMQEQARRHNTASFLFLDLKLNSWPDMIRGIAGRIQDYVQGAEWVGTVHVDQRDDNGLSRRDLMAAVDGGMRRVSFGLETGSQALLDRMRKGSSVERNSQFIHDAHAAGLSIRCTMFKGFPGETAQDMEATERFLETHGHMLDRVRFNNFSLYTDTPVWRDMVGTAESGAELALTTSDHARAQFGYRRLRPFGRDYRRSKARVLSIVHQINRRPLRDSARQFDGLM
ncbi:B12-binding domain-containing radical SAM protein [Paracoccus sp. 22332]|uniref:B12-binding domain-containing radical SAM protein n=1 Tax=Paracoccus sp. 22332 TaxID=3453913 RepID=UPI003F84F52A